MFSSVGSRTGMRKCVFCWYVGLGNIHCSSCQRLGLGGRAKIGVCRHVLKLDYIWYIVISLNSNANFNQHLDVCEAHTPYRKLFWLVEKFVFEKLIWIENFVVKNNDYFDEVKSCNGDFCASVAPLLKMGDSDSIVYAEAIPFFGNAWRKKIWSNTIILLNCRDLIILL